MRRRPSRRSMHRTCREVRAARTDARSERRTGRYPRRGQGGVSRRRQCENAPWPGNTITYITDPWGTRQWRRSLLRCMSQIVAHRVISRRRNNSVALAAKRTSARSPDVRSDIRGCCHFPTPAHRCAYADYLPRTDLLRAQSRCVTARNQHAGKSLLIFRNRVKPRNQKYFA